MKKALILLSIGILTACNSAANVPDYKNMTEEQQAKYMAKYKKEMMKIYSRANAMGKMKTTIEADASTDTITHLMVMDMEMKTGSKSMAKQVGDMMLEQNCKERFMREFVEAGISFKMQMKDSKGRTMVDTAVTPKRCEKFLTAK